MRTWIIAAALVVAGAAAAQAPAPYRNIPAPAFAEAIPLGPAAPPSPAERYGELWGRLIVRNVTTPRLIPVLPPAGTASGAAVIVLPGGGFDYLTLQTEGMEPAQWLAAHGIAAFVLVYRTRSTPVEPDDFLAHMAAFGPYERAHAGDVPVPPEPEAGEDALAALALVRADAARWGVDPQRVGMMGFSAGAIATMLAATAPEPAARPGFIGYLYGPMRVGGPAPAGAPPMFAAMALNDELFRRQGLGLIAAWQAAGASVEFHGYQSGGHGFGVGRPGQTDGLVMDEWLAWLKARGVVARPPSP
jgi:acetyl esterase/lipase